MKIEIEFSPLFVSIARSQHLSIELEGSEATVQGALHHLSRAYGERMRALLFEKGEDVILPGLMVMVNDQTYTGVALGEKNVPLMEGDKVSLLYFVSGG
jgi:molybdopterin converting factor small subunit